MCPSSRRRSGSWPWRIGLLRRPFLPLVAVAAQAGFARWPSSGSNCHLQWATWGWGGGGVSCAWPFHLQDLYGKVCGFSAWLHGHRSQGFRLSSIMSYHLLLSFCFTLSFEPSSAPFRCLPLAGLFALLLGPLRCFFAVYLPRHSHRSVRLLSARLSRWFSSLWPSRRPSLLMSFRRSLVVFHSSAVTPVCHLSLHFFFLPCLSRSLFHPSLLLGYVAVRLCGWSRRMSFALPSSCPPHFPGQDGFRAVLPLPSFCLSALPISDSFCGCGFVPPPGGVHAASAARLEVRPVRTHKFGGISSSVAFLSDGRLLCSLYVSFVSLFSACPSLKSPVGLCYMDT